MTPELLATIYIVFAALSAITFIVLKPSDAVFATYLGSWIILPVGVYPPVVIPGGFPIEIVGLTLPSQLLVTKAAIAPLVAAVYSLIFDWRRWRAMRPAFLDLPVIAFCLWPLWQGTMLDNEFPLSDDSALYFASTWGLSWWLGRLYLKTSDDRNGFLRALMISGIVMLPAAIVEAFKSPVVYEALYGRAPYAMDSTRYVGFRPMVMFEHGNQYGIWIALSALAAYMRAKSDSRFWIPAAVAIAMTIVAQSVAAAILMLIGILFLNVRFAPPRWVWFSIIAVVILLAVNLMTGLLPVERIAQIGGIGQYVAGALSAVGRGSMNWRIAQELRVLPLIQEHFFIGYGTWFWWATSGTRPWGFPMMMIGQYGLIGFTLIFLPVIYGPVRTVLAQGRLPLVGPAALGMIVLFAGVDSMLNNFIFWPAVLISGGMATRTRWDPGNVASAGGFARFRAYLDARSRRAMQRTR